MKSIPTTRRDAAGGVPTGPGADPRGSRFVVSRASERDEHDDLPNSLSTVSPADSWAGGMDLRWVILHLINETARHAGHADATREMLDGTTGE